MSQIPVYQRFKWRSGIGKFSTSTQTCEALGEKSLQHLGMLYLTGSDTTSYLYGKGKLKAINALQHGKFPGLDSVLGEQEATHADLMATVNKFMCFIYGVATGTSMGHARYHLNTKREVSL